MKRTLLLILAALLSCAALSAQDKIYFIDSRVVDALVDEVGEDMVYYRVFANQYGPTYSASVYSIVKIVYQNGYVQDFGLAAVSPLLAGTTGSMRYESGRLYLGSLTPLGEMQAEHRTHHSIAAAKISAAFPGFGIGFVIINKGITIDQHCPLNIIIIKHHFFVVVNITLHRLSALLQVVDTLS